MVCSGMIPNCPVTPNDINSYNTIFLNGEVTNQAWVIKYVKIPKEILQLHKTNFVASDIIFVNVMVFLVSISRYLKCTMVQYIVKSTTVNIYKSL